jgi:hypothetical protein
MTVPHGRLPDPGKQRWPGSFPLRPLAAGEVMSAGMTVVRRHFWILGPLAFAFSLASGLAQWGVLAANGSVSSYGEWLGRVLDGGQSTIPGSIIASTAVSLLITVCSVVLLIGLTTVFAGQDAIGRPTTGGDLRNRLSGRWPVLLLASAAIGAAMLIGLTLLIVPGVLVYLAWAFATPAVVMERADLSTALRRSTLLTTGGRGRLLGLSLLALLAGNVASALLSTVVSAAFGTIDASTAMIVSAVVAALVASVATTWQAAMVAVLYIDARMRRERLGEALWAAAHTPSAG